MRHWLRRTTALAFRSVGRFYVTGLVLSRLPLTVQTAPSAACLLPHLPLVLKGLKH